MTAKHRWTARVRWSEVAPAGILFSPRFFEWFDLATESLFESLGQPWPIIFPLYDIVGVPIAESGAKVTAPVLVGDGCAIGTVGAQVQAARALRGRGAHRLRGGAGGREDVSGGARGEGRRHRLRAGLRAARLGRSARAAERSAPRAGHSRGDRQSAQGRRGEPARMKRPGVVFTKSAPKTGFSEGTESPIAHVVRVGVYLRDMKDFPVFNRVFKEYFAGVQPVRTHWTRA